MNVEETTEALNNAALVVCRMRCWDPTRRVSETEKRTYFEKARADCIAFMQLHLATSGAGLLEKP
jgi:hypothetical protein